MPRELPERLQYAHKLRPSLNGYVRELEALGRLTSPVQEAAHKAEAIRHNFDTVFYIAGALTGVDELTKVRYTQMSDFIGTRKGMFGYAPHLHGTDPIEHPHVTPEEVRDIDYMFAVVVPDFHINFLHPTAHGNGVEAGWAEMVNIPAIYVVPEDVTLSRLVKGMRNILTTITYNDFKAEGLPKLAQLLEDIHTSTA